MLVVGAIVITMSAYAQDNGKQAPKKEESKSKDAPKQRLTIKEKSSNVKNDIKNPAGKEAKPQPQPAAQPKRADKKKDQSEN